jgi:uncharacterized membrane protein
MMAFDLSATSYILMIIIWLLVVGVGIWLLAKLFPGKPNKPVDLPDNQQSDVTGSALQILTKRYVRGEISKEQFAEMRRELER